MKVVLLPGAERATDMLELYDTSTCSPHCDITCALTLCSVVECDARDFLRERLGSCGPMCSDGQGVEHPDSAEPDAKSLQKAQHELARLDVPQMPVCIRIAACGHVFSAAPLLYELLSRAFRCPLC